MSEQDDAARAATPVPEEEPATVRVELMPAAGLRSYWSNFQLVQRGGGDFILSFYEIHPPAIVGSQEERKAAADKVTSLPAYCSVRVVIPNQHIPGLIRALRDQYQQFQTVGPAMGFTDAPPEP
jgi:hypothetical protein